MVVLYSIKPIAGETIASLCAVVILGGKKPFVVESACNIAEAFIVVEDEATHKVPATLLSLLNRLIGDVITIASVSLILSEFVFLEILPV